MTSTDLSVRISYTNAHLGLAIPLLADPEVSFLNTTKIVNHKKSPTCSGIDSMASEYRKVYRRRCVIRGKQINGNEIACNGGQQTQQKAPG